MKKFRDKNYNERLSEITNSPEVFLQYRDLQTENLIENYLSGFSVPVGILRDIQINNHHYVVPIATEEPSVIAAANNGAKKLGNINVVSEQENPLRRAQIIINGLVDETEIDIDKLFEVAKTIDSSIYKRDGGLKEIQIRYFDQRFTSIDLLVDTKEAMGANIVNTIAEAISSELKEKFNVITAIVSNLNTESLYTATAEIEIDHQIAEKISLLSQFGKLDSYRASTDNKGALNGASGVVLATGNDWRAFESGVYTFAENKSLSIWKINEDSKLHGTFTIPVAVGSLGGTISQHPMAQANLELMEKPNNDQLAKIITAVGLAQNFAALYALVNEGIQSGHMKLHNKAIGKTNE